MQFLRKKRVPPYKFRQSFHHLAAFLSACYNERCNFFLVIIFGLCNRPKFQRLLKVKGKFNCMHFVNSVVATSVSSSTKMLTPSGVPKCTGWPNVKAARWNRLSTYGIRFELGEPKHTRNISSTDSYYFYCTIKCKELIAFVGLPCPNCTTVTITVDI